MNSDLQSLAALPPAELRALGDRIAILLAAKGGKRGRDETPAGDFAQELYEALAAEQARLTQARAVPWAVFVRNSKAQRQFLLAAEAAERANARWFPKQSRVERASMLRLYAGLILSSLIEQQRPLAWYSIASALGNLGVIVDDAFPGYAACGLLGKVQVLRTGKRA